MFLYFPFSGLKTESEHSSQQCINMCTFPDSETLNGSKGIWYHNWRTHFSIKLSPCLGVLIPVDETVHTCACVYTEWEDAVWLLPSLWAPASASCYSFLRPSWALGLQSEQKPFRNAQPQCFPLRTDFSACALCWALVLCEGWTGPSCHTGGDSQSSAAHPDGETQGLLIISIDVLRAKIVVTLVDFKEKLHWCELPRSLTLNRIIWPLAGKSIYLCV